MKKIYMILILLNISLFSDTNIKIFENNKLLLKQNFKTNNFKTDWTNNDKYIYITPDKNIEIKDLKYGLKIELENNFKNSTTFIIIKEKEIFSDGEFQYINKYQKIKNIKFRKPLVKKLKVKNRKNNMIFNFKKYKIVIENN